METKMFNSRAEDDFYQYADNLDPERQQGAVIKRRLEELRYEQTKAESFYRPKQRVTHTDTESTPSCSVLEADNCVHCHASYGHKISCPTINREAAEELSKIDAFFLKSLRIKVD
jgi:hypothetical protein